MKFNTLALAALAVVAAPAFATIQTAGTLGEAEFVFIATNSAGSYAQDLGVSADFVKALQGGTSFTQAVAGAEWNKFVAFGGTNTQWAIIAVQPLDVGFTPGDINAWTTRNINQGLGTIQNVQSNDGTSNLGAHFFDIDSLSVPQVANNTKASAFGTLTYSDNGVTSFNGFFNARNTIGTTAQMFYLTSSNEDGTAPALYTELTTLASFNGTTVSLTSTAAIPEPSTYAMLFAGLAAVAFVARRRKA